MKNKVKTIAILCQNEALASILHMMLVDNLDFRVRIFADELSLVNYLHIVPIDLLIYDCSLLDHEITTSISYLRHISKSARNNFQTLVLCKTIIKAISPALKYADIDEVIVKPMSPLYFEERVRACLFGTKTIKGKISFRTNPIEQEWQANKQTPAHYEDNIVELFGKRKPANHHSHIE